jgi:hypothetical protein
MPSVLAWWLIPLGLTMVALGWALFRARPRKPLEIDEAIEVRNRVREALERPMPGQPARRLTPPPAVPVVENPPPLFPDGVEPTSDLDFTGALPVIEVAASGDMSGIDTVSDAGSATDAAVDEATADEGTTADEAP